MKGKKPNSVWYVTGEIMKKRNLKVKVLVAATVAVSTILAPLTGAIAEATTVTAKSGVNLRASGSKYSSKVGYISSGKNVQYLGISNGYYKLSVDGKIGYAYNSYLKGSTVSATSNVNMRSGASSSTSKVAYVYKGTEAKVLGRNGNWLYIEHNGKKGFSYKSYWFLSDTLFKSLPYVSSAGSTASSTPTVIRTAAESTIGNRVVAEAKKLLGAKYVYGGDSWSDGGFDCSGLTQYVWGRVGYRIPRTASQQWYGIKTRVSASNRRPGDVIIMTNGYRITHAGIYIGDNKMIHSPRPGKTVEIKSLDWYQREGRIKGYLRPNGN